MSILDKMESDTQPDIKTDDLTNISELSRKLTQMDEEIERIEGDLKLWKENRRKLVEDTLPNALLEKGLSEIKLTDGTTLAVTNYYSAKITDETREQAFEWLESNNLGDIIKNTVSASFGRKENDAAQELMTQLAEEGHDLVQKKWVEPMTLKATVKEQVEKGVALPLETFNVYIGHKIKVTK